MQIVILLAMGLVLSLGAPGMEPLWPVSGEALLAGAVGYCAVSAALSWLVTQVGLRRLLGAGWPLERALRSHRRHGLLLQLWLVGGLVGLVLAGLPQTLRATGLGRLPLLVDAVVVGLLFVACVLYWALSYRFDQAARWQVEQELMLAGQPVRAGWTCGQYMDFHIRHQFLFVAVPIGMIIALRDALAYLIPRLVPDWALDWAALASLLGAVGAVFFLSPLLLVRIWRTRPLPRGELRSRLERLCGRIGLRYRDILIWDTAGVVVNAGVMGLRPAVRYVLISDALLEQMEDRQIVAVFGHEAGHVVHRHIAYFLLFTVAAMLLAGSAVAGLSALVPMDALAQQMVMLGLIGLLWGFGFGWLSRQFERQADVYGAWCAGVDAREHGQADARSDELALGSPTFAAALENVARLNGTPRRTRNWRHGSIASRVGFLLSWAAAGHTRDGFDRSVALLKLAAWCTLGAGAVSAILTWPRWQ